MAASLVLLESYTGPPPRLAHRRRPTRRRAAADANANANANAAPPPPPPPRRERHVSWLRRGAPDAPGSPFHELGLADLGARAPKRRNYAALQQEQGQGEDDDESAAVAALPPSQAIFVDVGCGSGRFLLLLARRLRDAAKAESRAPMMMEALLETIASSSSPILLVGVDAQPALVERANGWARALEEDAAAEPYHPRCVFVAGDAPRVLAALNPLNPVVVVGASINFPDPVLMVKASAAADAPPDPALNLQRLRRCPALSEDFARLLGSRMLEGAFLLVQSECGRTAAAMVETIVSSGAFEVVLPPREDEGDDDDGGASAADTDAPRWCWPLNPLAVPTEREVYLAERLRLGDPEQGRVWRALFRATGELGGRRARPTNGTR